MTVDNISPKISKRCQIPRQMVSPFSGDKADCHILSADIFHFTLHKHWKNVTVILPMPVAETS